MKKFTTLILSFLIAIMSTSFFYGCNDNSENIISIEIINSRMIGSIAQMERFGTTDWVTEGNFLNIDLNIDLNLLQTTSIHMLSFCLGYERNKVINEATNSVYTLIIDSTNELYKGFSNIDDKGEYIASFQTYLMKDNITFKTYLIFKLPDKISLENTKFTLYAREFNKLTENHEILKSVILN